MAVQGLFSKNHENHEQYLKNAASTQSIHGYGVNGNNFFNNGYYGYGNFDIGSLLSIGETLTDGISDLRGTRNRKEKSATEEELKEAQDAITKVYTDAGYENQEALETKINETQQTIDSSTLALKRIEDDIATNEEELKKLEGTEPGTQKLENKINALKAQKTEEENKIKEANLEMVRLKTIQGEAQEKLNQYKELKKQSTGVDYDVDDEIDEIKSFKEKLNAFKQNPNKNTAQALKDAFGTEGKEGAIDNKTIKAAYKLIEKQVEETLKQSK